MERASTGDKQELIDSHRNEGAPEPGSKVVTADSQGRKSSLPTLISFRGLKAQA